MTVLKMPFSHYLRIETPKQVMLVFELMLLVIGSRAYVGFTYNGATLLRTFTVFKHPSLGDALRKG